MLNTVRSSWGADERRSLSISTKERRDRITRNLRTISDGKAALADWDVIQQDRLDRLYTQTSMPAAEYAQYCKRHDAFVIKLAMANDFDL